ncbi:uncharacterized protein LOC106667032 isoform X1 [Cimex lectularius]|uniref:Uncharacterized protein n=1 Tax=Cimex lectularius TaxID=79782 RepID=A0A8I6SEU0_CIMLE|nr:uncharacterized protein LOC106667032 isoform X1 [Cimex lectularius]XP_024081313.1 uncharacterized protein LOC106667032 isoform X1 [Cimex lectularius]
MMLKYDKVRSSLRSERGRISSNHREVHSAQTRTCLGLCSRVDDDGHQHGRGAERVPAQSGRKTTATHAYCGERSYIIAGRSARSEQHKRKIMQKSWMTMNVSKKELDDWVYKGNIHPEGLYKLRNYVIRMRRETRRKKLEWIQDARDILSRVKVPELTEKEVSYLAFYTEEDKVENVEQSKLAIALRHVVGKINSSAQEVSAGLATGISAAILFCYVLFRVLPVN